MLAIPMLLSPMVGEHGDDHRLIRERAEAAASCPPPRCFSLPRTYTLHTHTSDHFFLVN